MVGNVGQAFEYVKSSVENLYVSISLLKFPTILICLIEDVSSAYKYSPCS